MVLKLVSPLQGWCTPLEEVPDPVFAGRMLGDGVAIDPTNNVVHAPCAGEIVSVAAGRHALAIRSQEGVEVLLHVGIDTVSLAGLGFEPLVQVGERVEARAALLRFDLDVLAERAKSLITPIIITNADRFEVCHVNLNRMVSVGDQLLEVHARSDIHATSSITAGQEARECFTVLNELGIHARPAALIAHSAKQLAADIRIEAHGRSANAASPVSIMALGIKKGDAIELIAKGANARDAVRSLRKTILAIHEVGEPAKPRAASRFSETRPRVQGPDAQGKVHGVIASRGFTLGRALKLQGVRVEVKEQGQGISVENAEFDRARAQLRDRLRLLSQRSAATASELLAAHLEFLDDDELIVTTKRTISAGKSAGFAWGRAIRDAADKLRALNDERIAERIDDLFDLEMQMLQLLSGTSAASERALPERAILIADDLKPSQLIALEPGRIVGICLARGGPTSHVALLAASMGIPMLVALGSSILDAQEGTWIIVNAEEATISIAPSAEAIAVAHSALDLRERRAHSERAAARLEARTLEGTRIEVLANLASVAEAHVALNAGAEGCGLLRTEFLFLDRATPPDEEEQLRQYQSIAGALEGRPLIIRTLDIGGDKPIAYLPLPAEDNPALGLRGVRTSLWRADLLRVQLRAILQVKPASQCRVLLPMVTDTGEIHAVRRILDEVQRELGREASIPLGAMIETPASALLAGRLLREVDFLSIGTNDLTQYTLAMDRGHSDLAHRIDGLHPAVLTLIAGVARAGDEHKKLVAVCGGLASEPTAVPLLIGLGVRELSVVPTLVPQTKALVRTLRIDACERLAHRALELETAEQVRALAIEFAQSQSRVTS